MKQDTNLLSLVAAAGAGAAFMYYLDSVNGAGRRALARDKVVSAGRDAARHAQHAARHATGRMKDMAARVRGTAEADRCNERGAGQRSAPHATPPAHDSWNEQGV